jgi:peptidoglycan LD-endopeptidase LytH
VRRAGLLSGAGRVLGLAVALSALAFGASSSADPISSLARSVASTRPNPVAALSQGVTVLDRRLAGTERTLDRIHREAWRLRAASSATWARIGEAEDTLRKQVEQTIPSSRQSGPSLGDVGTRIDQAFRRLGHTLQSISARVSGMRSRLATARGGVEALQTRVDGHVREALRLLARIRAQAFAKPGGSRQTELTVSGRRVLVRLMVLKRDLAALRAELFGLADGLGRQKQGANDRLESALAREASEFGLPFERLPRRGSGWGVFLVCPVDPPRTVFDDFGAIRSGGGYHVHQGNDIAAPMGTPVRAPFSGTAVASPNIPGGLAVKVFGPAGFVYNAHLSRYGTLGAVDAGTVVGYVGNSGNASGGMPHDHFEWHPGGGGAVDPHWELMQVC